jgi:hypothetical protein
MAFNAACTVIVNKLETNQVHVFCENLREILTEDDSAHYRDRLTHEIFLNPDVSHSDLDHRIRIFIPANL